MAFDVDRRFAHARRRLHDLIDSYCNGAQHLALQDAELNRVWLRNLITFHRRSIAQQRSWRTVRRLPKGV